MMGNSFYVSNQKSFTIFYFWSIYPFDVWDKFTDLIYISDMWQFTKTTCAENVYICPAVHG